MEEVEGVGVVRKSTGRLELKVNDGALRCHVSEMTLI
jgi:hypothetical protein